MQLLVKPWDWISQFAMQVLDRQRERHEDRVYLSANNTLDGTDILLTTVDAGLAPLAADGQYDRANFLVNLPLSASLAAGSYFLIVQTDALTNQPESNESK